MDSCEVTIFSQCTLETRMNAVAERTFEDFHDNRIHGFRFISDELRSEIEFDIDHIIKWPDCLSTGEEIFEVAKAILRFNIVTDINISIKTGNGKYSSTPGDVFIERIERFTVVSPIRLPEYYLWIFRTNHEGVVVEFGAAGFSLEISDTRLKVPRQYLTYSERSR
jgi:hypothetical protein